MRKKQGSASVFFQLIFIDFFDKLKAFKNLEEKGLNQSKISLKALKLGTFEGAFRNRGFKT